jgi:glutamyl-tRNA synthetase
LNYCFAKHQGGEFLLRIEDTDQARSTRESETAILDSLHWLGLQWDEGPDIGGPHGPYRQSERSDIYAKYVQQLLDAGHAFKCYCTPERLDEMRVAQRAAGQPSRYDGHCLAVDEAQAGPYVVRMKVPNEGVCVVDDLRRGKIEFEWSSVDMQVLMKSDGLPTYHLANVVDDHLMEITHVMRGEEWVSSAPKHVLLYQYFGWEMPKLVHLPLLRNPDKSKLSKRKNPTGILFYKAMGYLPEALLNFLGLLANSVAEGQEEIMSLVDMTERFAVEHLSLGGPVFDIAKLDWLNGRYLREKLDTAAYLDRIRAWAFSPERIERIATLTQSRIERLSDLGPLLAFLFAGRVDVSAEVLRTGKLDDLAMRKAFFLAMAEFDALPNWNMTAIEERLRAVSELIGVKFRDAVRAFYLAITGSATSIPLFDSMDMLGRDLVRERLRGALEALGAPSKKEQDEWKKLVPTA